MYLPLGTYVPPVKLGLVSASRNCFPRSLSEKRTKNLLDACTAAGINLFVPSGECAIVESKQHALDAAAQVVAAGCDAAVFFLGNFSPEIEDAAFVKALGKPVIMIAAAEETAATLAVERGDALCGLLSAAMAISKRNLSRDVHIPQKPVVSVVQGVQEITHFIKVMQVVKGMRNATIGLFGPRPRDFETCNYNVSSIASIGVEVEELGFFDLANRVEKMKTDKNFAATTQSIIGTFKNIPTGEFANRLGAYELAVLSFREELRLSGMTSQCWSEQEFTLKHVPCSINARMAMLGFPIACENDAYSLIAELMGQYATGESVTILDINHSIPADLLKGFNDLNAEDCVGLFHCGNTDPNRLKNGTMKHQVIMKRLMEPKIDADITRGTVEGQIKASPLTVVQVHGVGDKARAYIAEGQFLDLDPKTFGCTGTAHIPGFTRFYRHALLGRFHHHSAVAFGHCGAVLCDALKMLGIEEIHTPLPAAIPYPGENIFSR